ncbi:MAG: hypothetical protein K2X02_00160 [Alphaproteobacteria bacterium]|nr:hypothetical protein [Alphaproteobacteria bacterium]
MNKTIAFIIAVCCGGASFATTETKDLYIQTDKPPPPSAEEITPQHPFFAEPTPANEVFESVEAQQNQIQKLEERVKRLEVEVAGLKQPAAGTNK